MFPFLNLLLCYYPWPIRLRGTEMEAMQKNGERRQNPSLADAVLTRCPDCCFSFKLSVQERSSGFKVYLCLRRASVIRDGALRHCCGLTLRKCVSATSGLFVWLLIVLLIRTCWMEHLRKNGLETVLPSCTPAMHAVVQRMNCCGLCVKSVCVPERNVAVTANHQVK